MTRLYIIIISCFIFFISCSKNKIRQQIIIPNGDFESWSANYLKDWNTNSCPPCVPPYETYIVKQELNAFHGSFAAKFIYNNVYSAWAENKFPTSFHPSTLTAFVKVNLYNPDTVSIKINLFNSGTLVDSGTWFGTSSILNYTKINIPISQNAAKSDSALIRIEGGHKLSYPKNAEFWVDNLSLQ